MSYRRSKKIKNYNTFNNNNNNNKELNEYIIISDSLKALLLRMIDMGDVIAKKIIDDTTKGDISARISWLNLTDSDDIISYTIPDKVKKPEDAWLKSNREILDIKKYKGDI